MLRDSGGCVAVILTVLLSGLLVGLIGSGCYGCAQMQTAAGYRDSTVRKVSESGLIWKTWEVETLGDGMLALSGDSTVRAHPETFEYSVSDQAILEQLRAIKPGQRVRLHYAKYLLIWLPRGESRYFVTRVELIP